VNARHVFDRARLLARHAGVLLRAGPGPVELIPALQRSGERMARALAHGLAPLLGGKPPAVRAEAPVETGFGEFSGKVAPLAANSLIAGGVQDSPLLVSVQAEAVFGLVDRAFGGSGALPPALPDAFPMSAELMIGRLEGVIMAALGAALGGDAETFRSLRRDSSLAQLDAFPADEALIAMDLVVTEIAMPAWRIALALPQSTLASLFGHGEKSPAPRKRSAAAGPDDAPFCDLPLPVRAVMAEVDLPVATVSALCVGQILPVPVARIVPLRIGARTVAHGTVGAVDDRVAVQVTRTC